MGQLEVDIPAHIDADIERLVDEGEFISREEAIEDLLTMGLSAYDHDVSGRDAEGDLDFAGEMRNPGDEDPGSDDFAF
ncbi:MAG: CopG family transcriptional regulator [Halobacteriaceae archaeon]